VLAPGSQLTPQDFFEFAKANVPYYAVPRYLELVDELPLTPTMRVEKYKLRERGINLNTIDLNAHGLVMERHNRRGV
jgi:crotonobetaine/carnitine-CoA ligase